MLINALHLNENALENYVATLEGCLRDSGSSTTKGNRGFKGTLDVAIAKMGARVGAEIEGALNLKDRSASRLRRLITAGNTQPDDACWLEAVNPDDEFTDAVLGTFIHGECDVSVPDPIALFANKQGLRELFNMFKTLRPSTEALGLSLEGAPFPEQVNAMTNVMKNSNVVPVVVGADLNTKWEVAGRLSER